MQLGVGSTLSSPAMHWLTTNVRTLRYSPQNICRADQIPGEEEVLAETVSANGQRDKSTQVYKREQP